MKAKKRTTTHPAPSSSETTSTAQDTRYVQDVLATYGIKAPLTVFTF